ncbi:hypothetical protein Poli38472_003664 [Pythium oligandrum]|uniref:E2 ubiquitin-conjugating enzyme n=1 Tax=Pythium oligandrum TaxID=41045 RepID=A0A8K1CMN2_PYTOL|nr:hypothetical protein Poli38472_003664 [Pythium oligandrum]|eukprot:TMW65899.1 hypothetical protein Poli38472_003664 [Pythium oligandrum]
MAAARENLAPQVIQRVAKEIRQLVTNPPNGIRYVPQEDEVLTEIHVEIAGPENTPYDGGYFQVKLTLSDGFPHAPPKGVFLTKIFHPNIATNGEICVNTLKKDWTSTLGIAHVLQVIRCLLIVPFPESSLNDEAGRLFMESYDEYARRARLWTNIHAPKVSAVKKDTEKSTEQTKTVSPTKSDPGDENRVDGKSIKDVASSVAMSAKPPLSGIPKVSTNLSAAGDVSLLRKRVSPTSMEALAAAQKKKSLVKKGIKRL